MKEILQSMGSETSVEDPRMKRIGKSDGDLVEFLSSEIRKEVLEKAKHLKTQKNKTWKN
jgi:hypothetical protein